MAMSSLQLWATDNEDNITTMDEPVRSDKPLPLTWDSSSSISREKSKHESVGNHKDHPHNIITTTTATTTTTSLDTLWHNHHDSHNYNNQKYNQNFLTTTTTRNDNHTIRENRQHFGSTSIQTKLKHRYDHLPSPPWPQLDHRTALAILHGHMLGFDPKLSNQISDYSNTIVTAYYEFESKHGVNHYEKWFSRILRTSEPMIIFVEPASRWFDFVKERRSHAPTIIAQLGFEDLVMSTTFLPQFWDFMHEIDLEAEVHKGSGVYKIWNEKLIFMYAAIHLNPFETPGFVWMDAGYFRNERDAPPMNTPIVNVNITEAGVPEEKLLLLHVRNDNLSSPSRVNIAGNAFVGTARSFLEFYPKYYQTFWDWVSIKKFIGSDQFVMTETCRRYKANCHPFFPGRYKMWFAMAYALSGKRQFHQVSHEYLFLDEPPTDVPLVPSGMYVSFCDSQIVTGLRPEAVAC